MKARTILSVIIIAVFFAGAAAYAVNNGAKEITIPGGKKGPVWFPHSMHQEELKDCKRCHDLFPREPGIIQKLKDEGKLKKKKVMNAKCVKCHKERKKAKQPSGPTKCSTCHGKK
ncbi:MAG: cytochrome c3 family protein [Desulfobacterales bacterium]|nr:cytochrome c3 family protein [Desulfobacterales bacterium]